jgi:hypothetical protein
MAEDFGKLSTEQVKKLANTINEAKGLTNLQADIIEKVIEGEIDIGELRISYLKEYFDTYSKNLDLIARKHSALNDAFLILNKKIAKSQKELTDAAEKQRSQSDDKKRTNTRQTAGESTGRSANSGNSGSSGRAGKSTKQDEQSRSTTGAAGQVISEDTRAGLEEARTSENIADRLAVFQEKYKTIEEQIAAIEQDKEHAVIGYEQLKAAHAERRRKQNKEYAEQETALEEKLTELMAARTETEEDQQARIKAIRLDSIKEVVEAETAAQDLINKIEAERAYAAGDNFKESGELSSRKSKAVDDTKSLQQIEDARLAFIAKKELEAKRKNNGILSAEESAKIQKQAADKFKIEKANLEKLNKNRAKLEAAKASADERAKMRSELGTMRTAETFEERKQALYNLTHDEAGNVDKGKAISAALLALSDLAKQLESKIDEIASYKSAIDTRLYGSSNEKYAGSYWGQLQRDMMSVGAINPYFKQETFANNIKALVEKGIAFDLDQRAFLMTIQEKIATTFNVADGTLLRLIRIQQEDSTAGRLGMEAALNSFLNNMYETTEYLSDVAASVRSSLGEMQSLMEGAEATEVEYQIQKWLGSLYSVGMSQDAVTSISQTLGQIAAGQIEGLTNGGAGNLLIMAASDAGLSIADILTDGLDSSDTNKLMQAVVNYLAEIAESSNDNNVVQLQLAGVFGVKASDLRAATNLAAKDSIGAIYGKSMTYDNMLNTLFTMAGSMGNRTSMAEMMTNFWANGQYTLASGMASNPVSYFIYKMASLVDDAAGGIDLPFLNVMGFGIDLNTTVADLMRVAAVGGGILGSIGPLISGLGNSFSGQRMLKQLGISSGSGLTVTPRGDGGGGASTGGGGSSTSGSGYVGNSSGSDIKNSTIQESEDSKKQQMVEAKEEEEANQVNVLNTTVLKIYELLDDVAHGNGCFRVKVEGYGLTKAGAGNSSLGGVGALDNSSSSTLSSGGVNSKSISGSIDFGGWTTTM